MDDAAPRFLIVRLSHIGDCVLTLPLAAAIKRAIPAATIVWATEKPAIPLLELHPAVDRIEAVPKHWLKRPGCWSELRTRLQRERFDWVLDPQSLFKSAALAWLTGCPRRVGFDGRHGRELSRWIHNIRVETAHTHLLDRTLDLLRPLASLYPALSFSRAGSEDDAPYPNMSAAMNSALVGQSPDFRLPVCPTAARMIAGWLASERIGRFVVINPGASWPSKQWSSERFGAVARSLHHGQGVETVVSWAGPQEFELAQEVFESSGGTAHVAPATTLRQFAALAARASLFIGCDTGPMHIAAASGTRCVVLHGPTRPEDSGAWGPGHVALQKWYQTGGNRQRRGAANTAMMDIQVEEVVKATASVLAQASESRQAVDAEKRPVRRAA
jgi:heptosyltransferase I